MLPDDKPRCPTLAPLLHPPRRKYLFGAIGVVLFILVVILTVYLVTSSGDEPFVLDKTPLFAGRNNLARNLEELIQDNLTLINLNSDLTNDTLFGSTKCDHCNTDFVRLKKGQVGSQFWVAQAGCNENKTISYVITQLDVITRMIKNYSDYLQLVRTSTDLDDSQENKKLGSMLFVDGGPLINSSTAFLRLFYNSGVRAMTLGSGCDKTPVEKNIVENNGTLNDFGKLCIDEMNTLGMMIDIQGLSPPVQQQVLNISRAPVLISHSAALSLINYQDNVDNATLLALRANNGLLMLTFDTPNLSEDKVNVTVADVIEHLNFITGLIGFDNIAIGGNYDSIYSKPQGLDDVAGFPALFKALKAEKNSKWTSDNLEKLAFSNFKRFFVDVENAKQK